MAPAVPQLRPVLLALFGLYLLVYPGSTLLVALDRVPHWGAWIGGALLIVQGVLMGLWLIANDGRRGVLAAGAILLLSWAVEHLGVTTGFPFGSYGYTAALQPKVVGVVPLAIPFAWLLVVPAAVGLAGRLLRRGSALAQTLVAASLALLLDVTIEPVAVHINGYWVWREEGFYYGVPASNFVAWWLTSLLLVGVLLALRGPRRNAARDALLLPLLPPALYTLNLTMFVLVNLSHSQTLAATIGLALLLWLLAQSGAARRMRAILTG